MGNQTWSPSAVDSIARRHLRLFVLNGTDDLGRDISYWRVPSAHGRLRREVRPNFQYLRRRVRAR